MQYLVCSYTHAECEYIPALVSFTVFETETVDIVGVV